MIREQLYLIAFYSEVVKIYYGCFHLLLICSIRKNRIILIIATLLTILVIVNLTMEIG